MCEINSMRIVEREMSKGLGTVCWLERFACMIKAKRRKEMW
jgi:hypothetical protein